MMDVVYLLNHRLTPIKLGFSPPDASHLSRALPMSVPQVLLSLIIQLPERGELIGGHRVWAGKLDTTPGIRGGSACKGLALDGIIEDEIAISGIFRFGVIIRHALATDKDPKIRVV
jgi:hypothetical protein